MPSHKLVALYPTASFTDTQVLYVIKNSCPASNYIYIRLYTHKWKATAAAATRKYKRELMSVYQQRGLFVERSIIKQQQQQPRNERKKTRHHFVRCQLERFFVLDG